ncbi:MAG: O-antigen ligase family protein [Aliivibrio sp.]|uniref:O-antigen ligase family protein n=1 Tax=Aliivibrio sp. TaxID=1872443 RepID=UPI001A5C8309|nr:O-antigen ligase family protein [Aliivibrio sp.]
MIKINTILSIFFISGILFFGRAFTPIFEALPGELASRIFTPISLIFYILSFYLIVREGEQYKHIIHSALYPLLICVVALLSSLLSFNITSSLPKSIALTGGLVFAIAFVITQKKDDALDTFLLAIFWALLISFFVSLLMPSIGIDDGSNDPDHLGLWQGIFGFKNNLGRTCAFFLLILYFKTVHGNNYKWYVWLLPIILLIMSKSTTPSIALISSIGAFQFFRLSKRMSISAKIMFIPILSFLILLAVKSVEFIIVEIFNKDLSGSGRSEMWQVILKNIDYSLFGYGFGGVFWGEGNPAEYIIGRFYYHLGHAHNGFIDALIDMGLIGFISYFIVLAFPLIHAIRKFSSGNKIYSISILTLVFLILYSLSGSSFLKQNNLLFIIYSISVFYPNWRSYCERNNGNR